MPEKNETRRELLTKSAFAAGAAAFLQTDSRTNARADEGAWSPASGTPSPCMKFFPASFRNERIKTSGAEINAVIGGSGPPVLMFHGAPHSVITWRLIAPDLAKDYTLVICDLRGYGDSSRPEDQAGSFQPIQAPHGARWRRSHAAPGLQPVPHGGPRPRRPRRTPHGDGSSGQDFEACGAGYRAGALSL